MAVDGANVTPLEKEAADEPLSFTFGGETWELVEDFSVLDFQEFLESGLLVRALKYALVDDYDDFESHVTTLDDIQKAVEALIQAVGGGSQGESRASRRSSQRRPRR